MPVFPIQWLIGFGDVSGNGTFSPHPEIYTSPSIDELQVTMRQFHRDFYHLNRAAKKRVNGTATFSDGDRRFYNNDPSNPFAGYRISDLITGVNVDGQNSPGYNPDYPNQVLASVQETHGGAAGANFFTGAFISPVTATVFQFSSGTVSDGVVAYKVTTVVRPRSSIVPFTVSIDIFGGMEALHWEGQSTTFQYNPIHGTYEQPVSFVFRVPLGAIVNPIVQVRMTQTPDLEFALKLPPLPIIAVSQEGQSLTDGLWNYATQMASGSTTFSELISLRSSFYPEAEAGTVDLDGRASYAPGSSIASWQWIPATNYAAPTQSATTTEAIEGALLQPQLKVTAANGLSTTLTDGVNVTGEQGSTGPLSHPIGAMLIPTKRDAGGTKIVRFFEGKAPETIAELPGEKGVHLMRHGATIYKGNRAGALSASDDDGGTFQMLSNAFPSGYTAISWCDTKPDGGFIALAAKDKRLYTARSGDGVKWEAPVLQFGDGTRSVSRASIRQNRGSGVSSVLITDGTFTVKSDDYCATTGAVLFS